MKIEQFKGEEVIGIGSLKKINMSPIYHETPTNHFRWVTIVYEHKPDSEPKLQQMRQRSNGTQEWKFIEEVRVKEADLS